MHINSFNKVDYYEQLLSLSVKVADILYYVNEAESSILSSKLRLTQILLEIEALYKAFT